MSQWESKMQSLGCELIPTRADVTESKLVDFEKHSGAKLPSDYRDFLSRFGGAWVNALAPISEPTPFGPNATVESFYGFITDKYQSCDIQWQCDLADGAPVAIPITGGAFGCQTFIIGDDNPKVGVSRGQIYFWDCDNRSAWPDEMFAQRFSADDQKIEDYLSLRRNNELPKKHDALADFYFVAESFTMFIDLLEPWDMDET